ncbi:benzoate-CoA ligase family protein [Limobrevibacterium gyesilva]|uniref:Benzoate-CoA ligase family protein n=1 Tax=Limobrevibacterium gyesilva TaxID=2991712 RepID=A0AA42CJ86_9PROT|nr:benzoate-CoA ligase family protein [Limobrevibacterium gyesilva]MCW3476645.1 benzoate-CoA ligase family protein [Limobrevibacterium gyesilva]
MDFNGNAFAWFVDRHVNEGRGERLAFADPARSLSYAGLQAACSRFATALARAGVGRERRVVLIMQDTVDFPVAFWGALQAGVVPVPVNTLLPHEQIGYILADSRAEAVVISAPLLAAVQPVLQAQKDLRLVIVSGAAGPDQIGFEAFLAAGEPRAEAVTASPDEVAFWLYSSGSTGAPKGTKHVHGSLRGTYDSYARQVLGIGPDDVTFSASKIFHAYGLGNSMTFPMAVGGAAVLLPDRPTPAAVLATMQRFQPTLFYGAPTLYAALLAHPGIGPGAGSARLRHCISAGEALPEAVGQRWSQAVGVDILDGIGSTEMLHIFVSNRPGAVRYGTTGTAVPGYALRIVDEHDQDVADGESGELLVRGPTAAEGYWNQRAKTRRTFQGEWTRTGDTYVREADGCYRYWGRADDMFKVSGVWVSPFEVESALVSHPTVLEAAVVGHPDRDGLIKPKAFVILQDSASHIDPDTLYELLKEHVKERAGAWKYPRWIEVVDSLPKTATGKIQRFLLRA